MNVQEQRLIDKAINSIRLLVLLCTVRFLLKHPNSGCHFCTIWVICLLHIHDRSDQLDRSGPWPAVLCSSGRIAHPIGVFFQCTRFPGLPMSIIALSFWPQDSLTSCDLMWYPENIIYILAFYHSHTAISNNTPHNVSIELGFFDRMFEQGISTHPFWEIWDQDWWKSWLRIVLARTPRAWKGLEVKMPRAGHLAG